MRLGAWKCDIKPDSLAYRNGKSTISERHRHRYEYNSEFVDILQNRFKKALNPDTGLVEIVK
jgi:CTP synthase